MTNACHVGVFPFPFSSHPAALLLLAKRLATLAPDVLFTVFSTAKANAPFFSAAATNNDVTMPPNIRPSDDVWDGIPEGHVFKNIRYYEEIELFMKTAPETLRKAVVKAEAETGKKVTCMMADPFMWCVADITDEMDVPWIAAWTSAIHPLAAHVYTDVIREIIGIHEQAEHRKDEHLSFIPGLSNIRVRDLPTGIVSGNLESVYAHITHEMGKVIPRAAVVLANTFEELDPELTAELRSKFKHFLCIGPFCLVMSPQKPLPDPHHCIPWLDHQPPKSVVYIGFGTTASPSGAETAAIATALEEVGVRFLWSLKPDKMSDLPDSLLDRVRDSGTGLLVPWSPQIEVLEHQAVGAFVTHFGWGSVMESIGNGVPLIGRPFVGDNSVNARLVEAVWGVGLVLEGGVLTKEGVVRALEKVMKDGEDRKRITENAMRLKDRFRNAVEPGRSSSENLNTLVKIVSQGSDLVR